MWTNEHLAHRKRVGAGEVWGMEAAKVTVKAVALITGDNNVRGSLQFVQHPNGLSLVFPFFFLVSIEARRVV